MSDEPVSVRLDHVGIDVRDLDGQVAFYGYVFGMHEQQRAALPQRKLVHVLLAAQGGWCLELFHRAGAVAGVERTDDTQHDVLGIGHLAVAYRTPDELRRLHRRAVSAGATSLMAPAAIGGPEVRAYLSDPEGVLIELIERPDGLRV